MNGIKPVMEIFNSDFHAIFLGGGWLYLAAGYDLNV